jgi:hypothetical protein
MGMHPTTDHSCVNYIVVSIHIILGKWPRYGPGSTYLEYILSEGVRGKIINYVEVPKD